MTDLRAKTGIGLPQIFLRPERRFDCDMYKAASRPGTWSRMTFDISGLFCRPNEYKSDNDKQMFNIQLKNKFYLSHIDIDICSDSL